MRASSVEARAVGTVDWLLEQTEIAVPVYQRSYRWDIDRCRRLLEDVRAAGRGNRPHFIGSVLGTTNSGESDGIVLVDGQQRVATLTLLVAALHRTLEADPVRAPRLRQMLTHPSRKDTTKLRVHEQRQDELARIVFGGLDDEFDPGESTYEDNYRYFLAEITHDAPDVCDALDRLEHVFISIAGRANAQQVFESLNSTSAPLLDHELIHNYILMGFSYEEQKTIETAFWLPIEESVGESIDQFFRHYLIQRTGREDDLRGEHGTYEVFKSQFPHLTSDSIRPHADEWRAYAEEYHHLLDPSRVQSAEIRTQLTFINVFGTAPYPIVMAVYHDFRGSDIEAIDLIEILEGLQALYLRKMVVGASRDHLAAQLCRRIRKDGYPIRDIGRRSPDDERVRTALRYRPVPHVGYVLRRLEGRAVEGDFEIEHIFPQAPSATWSGDGKVIWESLNAADQARYRSLVDTIGNLVLLEQPLNAAASNHPFGFKRKCYEKSAIASVRELAGLDSWSADAIEQRTQRLTDQFLQTWPRPTDYATEGSEQLIPILDAEKKPGWYPNWKEEFEFVSFRGESWEIHDMKTLFRSVFKRLWSTRRRELLQVSTARGGPIFDEQEPRRQWEPLDDSHFLFIGMVPQYMLADMQAVLDELGMAEDVFVSYTTHEL